MAANKIDFLQSRRLSANSPFFLIAGPCIIEDESTTLKIAEKINNLANKLGITFILSSCNDLLLTSVVFMVDDGTIIVVAYLKMIELIRSHAFTNIRGMFIHFVAIKISG